MVWNEIRITVGCADTDTAAAIATMAVPYGIYIEDYSDMDEMLPLVGRVDYVDDELVNKDRTRTIVHIYLPENSSPLETKSYLESLLAASDIAYEISITVVGEEEWAENWKRFYKPEKIGERLVVCPVWEAYDRQKGDVVMLMDPGMAFGSGKHETTSLCLRLIEKVIKQGDRVLDMGCGTGILSLGAMLLGAGSTVAVDVEHNAVVMARANAKHNGIADDRYTALCGNALCDNEFRASLGDGYDLICANIVADIIMGMQSMFFKKLKNGGELLASGIIDTRANEVSASVCSAGFKEVERLEDRGWVAFRFVKK